MTTNESLLLVE